MPELTFVHLTDLHVGDPDVADGTLLTDTVATLEAVLARIAGLDPRPKFIVASGDLTNTGTVASFRQVARVFAGTSVPVVYALGNHDTRPGFYQGALGRSDNLDDPYDHDEIFDGLHVITLDSSTPGRIGGRIEDGQFDWLRDRLGAHPDLRKLLVVHHPPALGDTPDATAWRTIDFDQSQRLATLLAGHPVVGILSGHIHHDRVSFWHGIPVIVGAGHHAATDILISGELVMVRGASFGLATLRASGLTMAFNPLPSDRAVLRRIPYATLLAHDSDITN